jgi:type VI secretion system secreted protein Hcp
MQDVHAGRAFATRGRCSLVAWSCAAVAIAAAGLAAPALGGAFLNLSGIEGESTNERHKNEIDVFGYDMSILVPPATSPNRPTSRVTCPPVTLVKALDSASLILAKKLEQDISISQAVLSVQRDVGDARDFFILKMQEVKVAEFSQTTSVDVARIVERVVLTARRYDLEYRPQSTTGGNAGVIRTSWDCTTGEVL